MLIHLLGYLTIFSQIVLAGGLAVAMKRCWPPETWLQKVPVPEASAVPLTMSSGSDYVGYI